MHEGLFNAPSTLYCSPVLSRRAHWAAPANRLTIAKEARRARGAEILDLTVSNPTTAGFDYPLDRLSDALSRAARAPYEPEPLGLPTARETVAQHLGCDAADVAITASTSEAYAFLFKLLADPGEAILTARPSYPLLEHLATLESVELKSFPLEFHGRWSVEPGPLHDAIDRRVRAITIVSPNNPTGSYVTAAEQLILAECGLPVISDEVFLDYPLQGSGTTFASSEVLTFTLGGLSKSAGLPHLKLGWIRIGGPLSARREAMGALELIADNFLSVSTPVQVALPELLAIAPSIRGAITARTKHNLEVLTAAISRAHGSTVLPVEGGWSAVIRVPRLTTDEDLALELLERGVLVYPGYFFDFERDGFLVVSLLTDESTFAEGIARIVDCLGTR